MNESVTVLNAVIPVFAIMAAGLVIRRLNWLSEQADQSLFKVVINLLMPCLILDTSLGNPAFTNWRNLTLAPLAGAATVLIGVGLAWLASGALQFSGAPARRTFAFCTGLQNYGYVPLPLTLLLFDERTTGVLFLHNLGVEICLWTVLLLVLTGGHAGRAWKQAINAPFVAILLAVGLNFTGVGPHLPRALLNTFHLLGQCAFPLALVLIGATVADHLGELHAGGSWREAALALVLRLGVMPLVILLLAWCLPAAPELKRVLVIEAAMPAATLPIVLARHYGGEPATALRIVLGTSAVSFITTPVWIHFGLKWLAV